MTTCERSVRAHLVDSSSRTELPVLLHYRAADPYAVTMIVGDERITWDFSRELLRAGTERPAGMGDLRLWPENRDLLLQLRSPFGQALLALSRAAVLEFLRDTETLVAPGTEHFLLSLDAELQALLDGDLL
jgi:hypothetical protein